MHTGYILFEQLHFEQLELVPLVMQEPHDQVYSQPFDHTLVDDLECAQGEESEDEDYKQVPDHTTTTPPPACSYGDVLGSSAQSPTTVTPAGQNNQPPSSTPSPDHLSPASFHDDVSPAYQSCPMSMSADNPTTPQDFDDPTGVQETPQRPPRRSLTPMSTGSTPGQPKARPPLHPLHPTEVRWEVSTVPTYLHGSSQPASKRPPPASLEVSPAVRPEPTRRRLNARQPPWLRARLYGKPAPPNAPKGSNPREHWLRHMRRQVRQAFVDILGPTFLVHFGENGVEYKCQAHTDVQLRQEDIVDVLVGVFRAHPKLFHTIRPHIPIDGMWKSTLDCKLQGARRQAEEAAATAIKEHMDVIAVPLFAELGLTYRNYQKLINVWCWRNPGTGWERIRLPEGTAMPTWLSKNELAKEQKQVMASLGMEMVIDPATKKNTCWLDPVPVLQRQLLHLHHRGMLPLSEGMTVKVQLLGDATGIWKSLKVNGTAIALKVWYDIAGPKREGDGCNVKANHRVIGFYLGDDCRRELEENLPHLPQVLQQLQDQGLDVELDDGSHIHVNFVLLLGGDLKFVKGLLGIAGNANSFPCPFCEVADHKDDEQLHWTLQQLREARVLDRDIDRLRQMAHVTPGSVDEVYTCPCCGELVDTNTQHNTLWKDNERRQWQKRHFGCMQGYGPFLPFIPVYNIIIDALHIVLRLTPALWRATVSDHMTGDRLENLHQWVYDNVGVIIAKNTAVQSRTNNSKLCKIGTESWHGHTCLAIMDWYMDILPRVHTQSSDNFFNAVVAWEALIVFYSEMLHGCDDSNPWSREVHAQILLKMAEAVVQKFIVVAGAVKKVIVYMHCVQARLPRQVRRHGSASKGSSQGIEALHQHSHRDSVASNRKTTAAFCLKRNALRGHAVDQLGDTSRKGGNEDAKLGGHKSKAKREKHLSTIRKARDRFFRRETDIPRTF